MKRKELEFETWEIGNLVESLLELHKEDMATLEPEVYSSFKKLVIQSIEALLGEE